MKKNHYDTPWMSRIEFKSEDVLSVSFPDDDDPDEGGVTLPFDDWGNG